MLNYKDWDKKWIYKLIKFLNKLFNWRDNYWKQMNRDIIMKIKLDD